MDKIGELASAVSELRKTFENTENKIGSLETKFNGLSALDQSKVIEINKTLDKFEAANQKLIQEQEARRTESEEFKKKIEKLSSDNVELVKSFAYKNGIKDEEISQITQETFANMLRFERAEVQMKFAEALKNFESSSVPTEGAASNNTIRSDIDSKGGYLVHKQIADTILKEASEISKIEQYASTFTTNAKTLQIDIDRDEDSDSTYFVNEGMEGEEETSSFDTLDITSYRQSVTVPVTRDMLKFSDRDITSLIMSRTADKMGRGAGRAFLTGSNINMPEGIMSSSKISAVESAAAATLAFDDIIGLPVADSFKSVYADPSRSRYYFNLRTLYAMRIMKDDQGQYLWNPNIAGGAPATLNGFGYAIIPGMDDIASGKYPILFGDLKKAYGVLKVNGMTMIRDEYTNKKKAIVEFTWDRWLGGRVLLAEAVRKLKIKSA